MAFTIYWFSIFRDVLEEQGVNSVNNKLQLQPVSIFLNHYVNFILQIKKQQKKVQLAQSIHYRIFPTICTIKKGFTCHKNPKPVFVLGECVHLCFM